MAKVDGDTFTRFVRDTIAAARSKAPEGRLVMTLDNAAIHVRTLSELPLVV